MRREPSESRVTAGNHRFPKSARLLRSEDFRTVRDAGRRRHSRFFVIQVGVSRPGAARFGLAVSKKVGNAVVRNRVKRWLREAIRLERAGVEGVDVVFVAREASAVAGAAALRRDVAEALSPLRGTS